MRLSREMDERRRKNAVIDLSSDESSEDVSDNDDLEEEQDDADYYSDSGEASESDDDGVIDDSSLSDKVVSLLQEGKDIESLKLNECKAYLRIHGLRLAGNRADCFERIKEHWRLKHGSGYTLYPRSSFIINCTGDVCKGDVVLFRQKVYEKFDKVSRHGKPLGNRTIAGRIVKESYGAAKQQHTFTVEVLWSSGLRKLPPLYPLLVKGRNLYKQKTYRQRWKDEADRVSVLSEKHSRGAAARSLRALKRMKKSGYANGSKGSKRQHEIQNAKRPKMGKSSELEKVRQLNLSRSANDFQPRKATSSKQTWKKNASAESIRPARGRHKSTEFDHYPQTSYQYQIYSQSRNEPSEFFYCERGLIPNGARLPPLRPRVGEFTSRSRHSSRDSHHCSHKPMALR